MSAIQLANEITDIVRRAGVSVEIRPGMKGYKLASFGVQGKRMGNPEFDEDLHHLTPENSFWIRFRDADDVTAAFICARKIETSSLKQLCSDYSLWYGPKIKVHEPLDVSVCEKQDDIGGTLIFDGSMFVASEYRGRSFSWCLSRLLRCVAMDQWEPDHYFGFSLPSIAKSRLPVYSYGYASIDPFARSFMIPGLPRFDLFLTPLSRQEAELQMALDLAFLRGNRDLELDANFAAMLKDHGQAIADRIDRQRVEVA